MQKVRRQSGGDWRRKTTTDAWNVTDRQTDRQLSDPEPPGPPRCMLPELLLRTRLQPKARGGDKQSATPEGSLLQSTCQGGVGGVGGWSTC